MAAARLQLVTIATTTKVKVYEYLMLSILRPMYKADRDIESHSRYTKQAEGV